MRRFHIGLSLLPVLAVVAMPVASIAQIISITIAPPELPVYEQPALPAPGFIWAPGYWAYGPDGYFWVPGTWVEPPSVGLLWTPGYWGWRDGIYAYNEGYWGRHIGFYGGVNYGYGYGGVGYEGGYWTNGVFAYNRSVNNFGGVSITNVYNKTVNVNSNAPRTSFNGGAGGIVAQPTPQEQAAAGEPHVAPTTLQTQHVQAASTNKTLLASVNHGNPAVAATSKPGEFTGKGVVAAKDVRSSVTSTATPTMKLPTATKLPTGTGALEKKGPTGPAGTGPKADAIKEHATINGATTPKPLNPAPPKAPNPTAHAAAPPPPHPAAAAPHPVAKPAPGHREPEKKPPA